MIPVTQQAHELIAALAHGSLAIDATAGNGNDTEFLARFVGPRGVVWAFDIQPPALIRTANRLEERHISVELHLHHEGDNASTKGAIRQGDRGSRVICIEANHAEMADHLPAQYHGRVAVVMFNLGYLPGADKSCITRTVSTLAALDAALLFLAPGGLLTVVVYSGHPGGQEEAQAVREWFTRRASEGSGRLIAPTSSAPTNPETYTGPQLLAWQRARGEDGA